jgi:hypothetical protein
LFKGLKIKVFKLNGIANKIRVGVRVRERERERELRRTR